MPVSNIIIVIVLKNGAQHQAVEKEFWQLIQGKGASVSDL
jgi:hypothetical protein